MTWLLQRVVEQSDAPAFHFENRSWSYRELFEEAGTLAASLQALGVSKGTRVAYLMGNNADCVVLIHALMLLGAIAVPLNTRLTNTEVQSLLDIVQPGLLVSDDRYRPRGVECKRIAGVADLRGHSGITEFGYSMQEDDRHCILFTSGTTGSPKAVPLTYRNHLASARGSAANLGVEPDDHWLCVLPLYHVGGLAIVLRSVIYGSEFSLHESFDPVVVNTTLRTRRITIASLVPTMLKRMLDSDPSLMARDTHMRAVLLGGGPAYVGLLNDAAARGFPILGTYGLTEGASQITTMSAGGDHPSSGSAGLPIEGAAILIRDEDGYEVPPGTEGEIIISGPMVFSGYLDAGEENQKRLIDGWFSTGDIGYMDTDGFLFVESRREDRIVTGGENVSPEEVESVLLGHPAVAEACVVGATDDTWGQIVAAAVVWNAPASFAQLEEHCRKALAGYKIPRRWMQVDEIPRTPSGKIMRARVRELFEAKNDQRTMPM